MTNLVISTPRHLLRHDLGDGRTYVIEDARHEYYGISWFSGDMSLILSHSGVNHSTMNTDRDYMMSEVGWISHGTSECWRFLSAPHQLICVGDRHIIATNTGRNCVTVVDRPTWSIRHLRFDEVLWDRLSDNQNIGCHFNSLYFRNGRLYVLAHNFDKGSFVEEVEWETLERIATTKHKATGLHNIWVRDDGLRLSCYSPAGGLIDLTADRVLWTSNDPTCYTRGMACSGDTLFVGASELSARINRTTSHSGIWVVDAESFQTRDYISLGRFGVVNEVRILDAPDLCHPNGPLGLTPALVGELPEILEARRRLTLSRRVFLDRETWDMPFGAFEKLPDDTLGTTGESLCLACARGVTMRDVRVSAYIDLTRTDDEHIDLVARWSGPGDSNMLAALFVKAGDRAGASLWQNKNGQWMNLAGILLGASYGEAELVVRSGTLELLFGGEIVLTASVEPPFDAGAVGLRGIRGRLRRFHYEALDEPCSPTPQDP